MIEIDSLLQRARLLIEQQNYDKAEKEIRNILQTTPSHPEALYLLAVIYFQNGYYDKALKTLDNVLHEMPMFGYAFYLKGQIYLIQEKKKLAEENAREALSIDSNEPDFYALMGAICFQKEKYKEALEWANKGLQKDANNITCLNLRSTALTYCGKSEEAFETIHTALNEDPHNSYTHTNYGWGKLHKGQYKEALHHFNEALRLDPENEMAKSGLTEALKAKSPLYKLYLQYATWMTRQKRNTRWIVIIGIYIFVQIINSVANNNPVLEPFIAPIVILFVILAFSSWILSPIHNIFLLLSPYSKNALQKQERVSASLVGLSMLMALVAAVGYVITNINALLASSFFGLSIMVMFGNMFNPTKAKHQRILIAYATGMILLGLVSIGISFKTGVLISGVANLYIIGFLAFQIIANYLASK